MNLIILNKSYFRKTMTVLQCVQKNQSCSVSECLMKTTLLCLSFTQLTQLFLNGKVSSTISRPTKARHLLFLLDMGGVVPGKLGASLHNSDADRKDRNQFPMKKKKKKSKRTIISVISLFLTCWWRRRWRGRPGHGSLWRHSGERGLVGSCAAGSRSRVKIKRHLTSIMFYKRHKAVFVEPNISASTYVKKAADIPFFAGIHNAGVHICQDSL